MGKRMVIMLLCVGLLFGAIFGYQFFKAHMMKKYMASQKAPAVTVSTTEVKTQAWQSQLKAVSSLRAVQGVDVTTEIAGLVRSIYFVPGANVKKGDLLVKLNTDTEAAQLRALQATSDLANITYQRDKAQFAIKAVSKQAVDNDEANLKNLLAQVAQQQTLIDKKTIQAPFSGKLGISAINPGQYVNPGDMIVTLQALNPIYVDFYVPQQSLLRLTLGQKILVTTDSYPGITFTGKITTINPKVDPATRNIQVEATVENAKQKLLPGMFANVEISTGKPINYLTLPQTAISYNPYGEIVYIVTKSDNDAKGQPQLVVEQIFVKVGPKRGDQIAVLEGLKEGQTVVTSGQLKLKNGSAIIVNNSVKVTNNPYPDPVDN